MLRKAITGGNTKLATYLLRRQMSTNHNVVKYQGENVNVTPHNKDKRAEFNVEHYTFWSSLNVGYENFSKPIKLDKMHQQVGGRSEYLFLFLFFPAIMIMKHTRKKNEAGIRQAVGHSNNRYSHFATVNPSEF